MTLISDEYRKLNEELHEKGNYGITAPRHFDLITKLIQLYGARVLLDYGSGTKKHIEKHYGEKYRVHSYDPCVPELSGPPPEADVLICCDVLEHIEPEFLDNVLQHISSRFTKAAYLSIATRPAHKILSDGRNAHLIVQPHEWWEKKLLERFTIITDRKHEGESVFIVN